MIPFINRERELDFLEKQYAQSEAALIILYGRRRVGKTRLLREFVRGKPHLYFLADDQLSHQQIRSFQDMAAEQLGDSMLPGLQFSTLEHLFRYLVEHLPLSSKWVLVIDEFQYLVKSEPATPSIFQRLWDLHLKDKPIMLILCGSLTGMMERYTLNYSSPLYGRRTGQIKLRP
ncbi:MAG: ATP-binding protein, partial [Calditrichaeota bacterium]